MKFIHENGSIVETDDRNTFNLFERNGFVEYIEPEIIVEEKKIEIVEVKPMIKPVRKPPGRPKK